MSFSTVPKLTFKSRVYCQGFCHRITKGGDYEAVIFKFLFCWLLFRAKFDCNFIQSYIPYIGCGNLL